MTNVFGSLVSLLLSALFNLLLKAYSIIFLVFSWFLNPLKKLRLIPACLLTKMSSYKIKPPKAFSPNLLRIFFNVLYKKCHSLV